MPQSVQPINSPRYRGRYAIAAPELGIPYLAEAGLFINAVHDRHAHDEIQVLWVLEGDMGMEIGRTVLHLVAGQGLILLPGRRHRVVPPVGMSSAASRIVDLRLTDDPAGAMVNTVRALPAHTCLRGDATGVAAASDRLRQARERAGQERSARLLSAVWALIAEIAAEPAPADVGDPTDRRLRLAEQYMNDHLSDSIGVDAIADHVGLSRSQLTRLMVERTGYGPAESLRRLRVARADSLLRQSTLSIKEIARVCGFATQHHFSRVFHEVTGKRPTESR